jgi:hypothetical protein
MRYSDGNRTATATATAIGRRLFVVGWSSNPVPCLLFADDLVLLSSTRAGLHAMLGTLERFLQRSGLTVNRSKTKVVVFGMRFEKARAEGAFYIDEGAIKTVSSCIYLGVEISCGGSCKYQRFRRLVLLASLRASHALRHRCAEIHLYDPGLRAELFDSLIRPVLLHGLEIWGFTAQIGLTSFGRQESDAMEHVHRSSFESLLGGSG